MLNEPLVSLILLLFLLMIAAVLAVWFALSLFGGGSSTVARETPQHAIQQPRHEQPPQRNPSAQPQVVPRTSRQVTIRPSDKPLTEAPRLKSPKPTYSESGATQVRRVSNDQFRGAKVKARRRDESSSPNDSPSESLEDAFERFIRSKNDDLNF
jgi:hypothetical protein